MDQRGTFYVHTLNLDEYSYFKLVALQNIFSLIFTSKRYDCYPHPSIYGIPTPTPANPPEGQTYIKSSFRKPFCMTDG